MRSRLLVFLFAFLFTAPLFAADRPLAASAFPLPVPQYLAQIFTDAGHAYNLDPNLIAAVAFHESAFNTRELSPIGATGLMQLLPNTGHVLGADDLYDPRQNVFAGTKYLKEQLDRFHGNLNLALAAYTAGYIAVQKSGPDIAAHYVNSVRSLYDNALRAL